MPQPEEDGFTCEDRDLLIRVAERMTAMGGEITLLRTKIDGKSGLMSRMVRAETRIFILGVLVLGLLGLSGFTLSP